MTTLRSRLHNRWQSPIAGVVVFATLATFTAVAIAYQQTRRQAQPPVPVLSGNGQALHAAGPEQVQLSGTLSQNKLVQGGDGTVYLSVDVEAPAASASGTPRQATDLIVVLDHSGSMAADNRLPFAKQALRALLEQLTVEDRFGLVVFDSNAAIASGLVPVDADSRSRLHQLVDSIQPGSGTNMSAGLLLADKLQRGSDGSRQHKILLLSDGEANEGIVAPAELARLSTGINEHGAVVSTIGMGLGFNETLMSSLADAGMGSYAYLEHLGGLAGILNHNLNDARNTVAHASRLELTLPGEVSLTDAGGFPIERLADNRYRIATGQVLSGKRHFTLTFALPTGTARSVPLGSGQFVYQTPNGTQAIDIKGEMLTVAVLPAARRAEAVASVNTPVLQESWLSNNLGRLKSTYRQAVAAGRKEQAQAAIEAYKADAGRDERERGVSVLQAPAVQAELREMKQELDDAFVGSSVEQKDKQNRLAKKAHAEAITAQRGDRQ